MKNIDNILELIDINKNDEQLFHSNFQEFYKKYSSIWKNDIEKYLDKFPKMVIDCSKYIEVEPNNKFKFWIIFINTKNNMQINIIYEKFDIFRLKNNSEFRLEKNITILNKLSKINDLYLILMKVFEKLDSMSKLLCFEIFIDIKNYINSFLKKSNFPELLIDKRYKNLKFYFKFENNENNKFLLKKIIKTNYISDDNFYYCCLNMQQIENIHLYIANNKEKYNDFMSFKWYQINYDEYKSIMKIVNN